MDIAIFTREYIRGYPIHFFGYIGPDLQGIPVYEHEGVLCPPQDRIAEFMQPAAGHLPDQGISFFDEDGLIYVYAGQVADMGGRVDHQFLFWVTFRKAEPIV